MIESNSNNLKLFSIKIYGRGTPYSLVAAHIKKEAYELVKAQVWKKYTRAWEILPEIDKLCEIPFPGYVNGKPYIVDLYF